MKKINIAILIGCLFSTSIQANDTVYKSYEELYTIFADRIFDENHKVSMQFSFTEQGNPINYAQWQQNGKTTTLFIAGTDIKINHKKIPTKSWYLFRNEMITDTTLATGATLYFSETLPLICVEGHPVSSSGWESRNNTVYLIDINKHKLIKPASLFASCLSIQASDNNKFTFPSFVYYSSHYAPIKEIAQGVILEEYSFLMSTSIFEDTQYQRFFKFIDQSNGYYFTELQ